MVVATVLKQFLKPDQVQKVSLVALKAFAPANRIALKYGPEILVGTGIAGGVTAAVLGAKATLKLEPVIDRMNEDIQTAQEAAELINNQGEPIYEPKVVKRTIAQVKIRGAFEIAKLYAPAVTIGIASIACVLGAHGIMKRREVGLIAAYNALEKGFAAYRKRVIDEFGEEKDQDYRFNITTEKVKDEETGKTKTVSTFDPNGYSIYAKVFGQTNKNWNTTPEYSMMFLKSQQQYATQRLHAKGHVFLNEVYDALGFEHTQAGAHVGWVLGKGDDFVDFGIYDIKNERKQMFINGEEPGIVLDFNVSGPIIDLI